MLFKVATMFRIGQGHIMHLTLRLKSQEHFGAADHIQSLGVIGRPRKSRAWRSNSMYPAGSTQSLIGEGQSDTKLSRSSS